MTTTNAIETKLFTFLLESLSPSDIHKLDAENVIELLEFAQASDFTFSEAITTRLLYVFGAEWTEDCWKDDAKVAILAFLSQNGASFSVINQGKSPLPSLYSKLVDNGTEPFQFLQFVYVHADSAAKNRILRQIGSMTDEDFYARFREFARALKVLEAKGYDTAEMYEFVTSRDSEVEAVISLLLRSPKLIESLSKDDLQNMIRVLHTND